MCCPLLPAILTGANAQHRLGPVALAGGLALSFAGISLFVATVGYGLGLTPTGLDRSVQSYLVAISPGWLTALTTRF